LLNPLYIIYIINIFMLILCIVLLLSINKHHSTMEEQIQKIKNALNFFNVLKEGVCYIATEELIEFERNIKEGEIIIFSSEISFDIKEPFFSVISENMKKDVRYKYILPDTVNSRGQYNKLKAELDKEIANLNGKLKVIYLPEKCIISGITLYTNDEEEKGVINVPHREYEKNYFITMDTEFFNRTKECINELIETFGISE